MNEEFRVKQELNQLGQDGTETNVQRRASQNQSNITNLSASNYLPELSNRQSEPIVESGPSNPSGPNESIRNLQNASNKFENTAAFPDNRNQNGSPSKNPDLGAETTQKVFSNAMMSESNKIKEMINQCDNK